MANYVHDDPYENLLQNPGKEAFARLFRADMDFRVPPRYLFADWKIAPRNTAVQLIETLYPRATHAFDHLIPYTAMTYFDRFFATHDAFPNVLQTSDDAKNRELFVICCLTISWKLRDHSFFLAKFLRQKNLVYSFDNVREMELEICRGLEWRMRTLTPFLFVGFFSPYLVTPIPRSVFHDLIYRSQRDIAFTAYRASVIALSAMLAIATVLDSAEHSKFILDMLIRQVHHLIPIVDAIEQCRIRLVQLHNDQNPPDDNPPAGPASGPGTSSDQSTNLAPGQTSAGIDDQPAGQASVPGTSSDQSTNLAPGQTSDGIDDPPTPVSSPSSPPGQTSSDSSGTPPAAATERPRQRPGKEHVTDSGQLQLGGQNADPNAVTKTAADVDMNDQALVQDAGDIQVDVANQDDQITGQVGDEEAEVLEENESALAERSGRTSIAQKLSACCTIL